MNPIIKKLGSQTVIYGLSTILGRFLNYLLLPIHTRVFHTSEYGVITEFYAYVAFLNVIFSYGMETTFFRYASQQENLQEGQAGKKVYGTSLASLLASSLMLSGILILLSNPLARAMQYPDHAEYIVWFALILGLDAIVTIPFARLRQENRPLRFAFYKLVNIGTNVGFNLFFLVACPYILTQPRWSWLHGMIQFVYHPQVGVGYVFISNLIASAVTLVALRKYFYVGKWSVDFSLWKKMMAYSLPLIIVGLAGMVDEMLSRAILKYRLGVSPQDALHQLGVFGACYKLAILMTLFIQAFRMAAEPFFFNESQKQDAQVTYAKTMNYFTIAGGFIFIFVTLFIDVFKNLFITPEYYEGLKVVPILLMANLFLGIYYNLTIWYKLTNQTRVGALVALYGAALTFLLNWFLIPHFGYVGSSWVTFICYGSMVVISFFLGQKFYPVPYSVARFFVYAGVAVALYYLVGSLYESSSQILYYGLSVTALGLYGALVYLFETGKIPLFKPIR